MTHVDAGEAGPQGLGARSREWARDFGLVGGMSGLFAFLGPYGWDAIRVASACSISGALTGAALGAAMPGALDWLRRRVPLPLLFPIAVLVGFAWGAATGVVGALLNGGDTPWNLALTNLREPWLLVFMGFFGGVAAALQFGWLAPAYAFQAVRGRRTWPTVAVACALTPGLGVAALCGPCVLVTTLFG